MNTRHLRTDHLRGKRWRGYLRESTERQTERGTPLDRQRADILRAADELGLVPAEPVWYSRTGTGEHHSLELDQAIAEAAEYDVLLVFHSSRLARNTLESALVRRRFADAGLILYFVAQHMISGARTTSLAENVQAAVDAEENEVRRMWIAGGLRQRQLAGRWTGQVPFGYTKRMVDRPDGSRGWDGGLVPQPEEAATVRRIFARFVAGEPTIEIVRSLNAAGRNRGGLWSRSTIVRIVKSPTYTGRLRRYAEHSSRHYYPEDDPADGRRDIVADWPALVDEATFEAAQVAVRYRRRTNVGRRGQVRAYPLSKVLRCGRCHAGLVGVHNNVARYYRCYRRRQTGSCDAPYVRADAIEEAFADWFGSYTLPADWRRLLAAQAPRREIEADERKRAVIDARLRRLRDLYAWGDLGASDYRTQVDQLRGELAEIAPVSVASVAAVAEALADLGRLWRDQPWQQQAAVARLIVKEALVEDGRVEWVARPELRPVLALCTTAAVATRPAPAVHGSLRFSA